METGGGPPSPLTLSAVKLSVSSRPRVERFGTESAFLLGGFLGVLKEDLEKRGILPNRTRGTLNNALGAGICITTLLYRLYRLITMVTG